MRNTIRLFAAIALCIMLFASCKKEPTPTPEPTIETGLEGQFMPERKIASIERFNLIGEDSLRPVLQNHYEWNGDLLSKITQTQFEGTFVSLQTIHYDSLNRIAKIDYVQTDEEILTVLEYIYEGKELAKVKRYKENGELLDEYTFIRTDGKVTEIQKYTYMEPIEYSSKTVVWVGDNTIQIALNQNGGTAPTDYTFDDKINPLYGLYEADFYFNLESIISANNILTSTMVIDHGGINLTSSQTYEYEYDDKGYPVKATLVQTMGFVSSTSVIKFTYLE